MKTPSCLFLVLLIFSGFQTWGQTWCKILGSDSAHIVPAAIVQDESGAYLITGTWDALNGSDAIFVAKIDRTGDLLWTRLLGGVQTSRGHDIIPVGDGGAVVASETYDHASSKMYATIVRLDGEGHVRWSKSVSALGYEDFNGIAACSDGGFIVTGSSREFTGRTPDYHILTSRFDSAGNMIWSKLMGIGGDLGGSVIQTRDGGFAVAGSTGIFDPDMYILKLDQDGDLEWTRTVAGSRNEAVQGIVQAGDGSFYLAGNTNSFGPNESKHDVWVVKLSETGDVIWSRTVADEEKTLVGWDITLSSLGTPVITGSQGNGSDLRMNMICLDDGGNLTTPRIYAPDDTTVTAGRDIIHTSDGGYALVGLTRLAGLPYHHGIFFIKLDDRLDLCLSCGQWYGVGLAYGNGEAGSGGSVWDAGTTGSRGYESGTGGNLTTLCYTSSIAEDPGPARWFEAIPSPFTGTLILRYRLEPGATYQVGFTDIRGSVVFSRYFSPGQPEGEIAYNLAHLRSGLYLVRLTRSADGSLVGAIKVTKD